MLLSNLLPKKPIDWGKCFIYACLIAIGCLIMFLFKSCGSEPIMVTNNAILKQTIKTQTFQKDSVKKKRIIQDSVRIKEIHHWHTLKGEVLKMPCDTALQLIFIECDTIIKIDSLLISSLKTEIKLSDSIISNQQKVIKNDSIDIRTLTKELKKQKRQKKFFMFTTAAALGLFIAK